MSNISYLGQDYFKFELSRIPGVIFASQQVTLPGIAMSDADQPTTLGIPIKRPIGAYRFQNFEMTFLVDEQMKNWLEIYKWMRAMGNIDDDCTNNSLNFSQWMTDGNLYVTNGNYRNVLTVTFKEIFPIALSGLKFISTSATYEPQMASATFAYTYYTFSPDPGNPSS
jgi:hypothetical protein